MHRAHHMLTSTALPLKQIAHELGYNHTSNFCLAFKRNFGITPRQARCGINKGRP
jgi:AraC-like DNA-binding protein